MMNKDIEDDDEEE